MAQLETINRELKRRAAALLASGTMSQREVAMATGVKPGTVSGWMRDDDFLSMVSELAKDQTREIEESVKEAARLAAARLIAHLTATNNQGKPIWDVQWNAIKLALAYSLGQPVEKSISQELQIKGDLNKELRRVLSDPTVRHHIVPPPVIEAQIEPADQPPAITSGASGGEGPTEVLDLREPPNEVLPGNPGSTTLEQTA